MALDKDDIKTLIAILQKGLVDDDSSITETETSGTKPRRQSKHKIAKSKKTPKGHNKFLSMPEMHMHKEDLAFDRKVLKNDPVPRRQKYTDIEVRCRVCGRTEKVNPSLIESVERYKCNKCSSSAG